MRGRDRGRARTGWPAEVVSVTARPGHRPGLRVHGRAAGRATGARAGAVRSSARLGPGLLGGIFDGLLRPLTGPPPWLSPGALRAGRRPSGGGAFVPAARAGGAVAGPGTVLGTVADAVGRRPSRARARPGWPAAWSGWPTPARSTRTSRSPSVGGRPVPVSELWPVRTPRPVRCPSRACRRRCSPASGSSICSSRSPRAPRAAVPGGFGTGKTVLLQQTRQVVPGRCGRLRRVRGARQRAGRRSGRPGRARGPADRRQPARADGGDRQHLEHARDGPRGEHLHRHDRGRVLPRHGLRRGAARRLHLAVGRGAARVLLAQRRAAGRGGLSGGAGLGPGRLLRAGRPGHDARRHRGVGHGDRRRVAAGRRHDRAGDRPHRAVRAMPVVARSRPRLRPPLPGGHVAPVVLARRAGRRAPGTPPEGRAGWARDRARAVALLAEADRLGAHGRAGRPRRPAGARADGPPGRPAAARGASCSRARSAPTTPPAPRPSRPRCWSWCSPSTTGAWPWSTRGVPASAVEEIDLSGVTRVRDEVGPDDAAGVDAAPRRGPGRDWRASA